MHDTYKCTIDVNNKYNLMFIEQCITVIVEE